MILCKYSELGLYAPLLPHLEEAMKCIDRVKSNALTEGRYCFDGGYLFVQSGTTAPIEEGRYETHRKYLDIQYMLSGE